VSVVNTWAEPAQVTVSAARAGAAIEIASGTATRETSTARTVRIM
jgi:hypothetical protein